MAPAALTRLPGAARRAARVGGGAAAQLLARPRSDHVVYNSFRGHFSDSPRAIYEELARRASPGSHVWIGSPNPAAPRFVAPNTAAYFRELGRAGYLVSNVQMPGNLIKRRGAVYLQTWHGTPLKKIGLDNPRWRENPAARDKMVRDVAKWDYLVSQNAFSTEILRRAFGFDGEILETGYPRNDVLNAPDRSRIRAALRRELGIADGQRAVLYAPTWRDDDVDAAGGYRFEPALDLAQIAARLGGDHVLLLRLHYMLAAALGELGPHVRNVSHLADIGALYLAADVLVTDYSSAMFDFAVTGKPMVFYTYDLERYRDRTRGFYFDLESEAPGPICRTTEEVAAALLEASDAGERHGAAYERFRARFCPYDDGRASARVVDRVFGGA
jgi:CDP-glycerol glycerophosphotransferase